MRWYEYKMEVDDLHASDDLKATLLALQPNAAETPELTAARFAAEVRANIRTESNMRGSAEYRNHLAGVLVKRAVLKLEGNR